MIGIYARQSVEKKDSISIAYQIARCKAMYAAEEAYEVFQDQGFSGKNTQRPGFQNLLQAIQADRLSRVIVYKLDRISRSLSDFLGMMQLFQAHHVTLLSCCEAFDTTTELGNMMLKLLMMFAEMEQKTIAARVRDNYYARGETQQYLGGYAPYGFQKEGSGAHAYFKPHLTESAIVRWMYQMYGLLGKSVEELVQTLNQDGICTKTGHCWSQSSVARILHNPIYVQADAAVYRYFQQQHAILPQQADAYTQGNGCLVYGNAQQRAGSKFTQLEGEHIMPCQHRGYIPAALWLTVQKRLQARAGASNRGSGSMTWLQGLLLCGCCNLRFYGKRNGAGTVYLVCRGKRQGICPGIPALRAEVVEAIVAPFLLRKIQAHLAAGQSAMPPLQETLQLDALEERMQQLTATISSSVPALRPYLLEELGKLHQAHQQLEKTCEQAQQELPKPVDVAQAYWQTATIAQRKRLAQLFLEKVLLEQNGIKLFFY